MKIRTFLFTVVPMCAAALVQHLAYGWAVVVWKTWKAIYGFYKETVEHECGCTACVTRREEIWTMNKTGQSVFPVAVGLLRMGDVFSVSGDVTLYYVKLNMPTYVDAFKYAVKRKSSIPDLTLTDNNLIVYRQHIYPWKMKK